MKFEFIGRNYQVAQNLKDVTEKKLSKLDKYFIDQETLAKVCFKKEASTLTTEVTLEYAGKFVRATASSDNFYDNLDVVLPKIEGQIRKYRTRFDKHQKNASFKDAETFFGAKEVEEKTSKIVKTKEFKLVPMTVEEATEQMDLLGHSFYVFKDAKTGDVKILYLRNDGDLGLIEPQA